MKESGIILIETNKPFDQYIQSLSAHARADWAYVRKHNKDITYEQVEFNRDECDNFMRLWEQQLVRGKGIQWAFPIEHVEDIARRGELQVFRASNDKALALQFIQQRNGYWECHPPMYAKKYNRRYLGKLMWFNLIRYAIQNSLEPLNMGGGLDNWRDMIKRRDEFPNPAYKWIYVPQETKDNPDSQPNYYIEDYVLRVR